ncbi:MAG: hypothetical protein JGK17_18780 [Microcoleus sp. PH2017_10_PVI_O_A]|uniref:hypothetical protein n=1 Tax=unclassified Microcoleus TaxID=2642155 RepID=UPI001D715973|nr:MULTISPECIES: hypothetical protein [unclassified Microcoleus]TAE78074.1 MAG: hypothetical protein EAZ83_25290 [Oscillatoriales cyanobacterium]MCC3407600.1 hypothetical protein [Microcoleus sp. PH2017_10_PVI_O_A]MCC3461777.1 hypothetical protein [Microcoleus sp. PH2017_11_PCY_U_A]MCC3480191.1 hypothetical protein [Microcoleus sp. PH2017_12_PCY_D_A]MCC3527225.1 hypothetical protein [Microcoleus sp. PH2017_21_RUC_O_A]
MNDGNSDDKLVNFLKQNRPKVPDAAPDFEQRVLAAIDRNDRARELNHLGYSRFTESSKSSKFVGFPQWGFPAAIVAGLLVFGSGYRALVTAQLQADEAAHLEAFLVNNWEGVLNDSRTATISDRLQPDLFDYAVTADTEPPTN